VTTSRKLRRRARLVPHTAALRPRERRLVAGLPVTSPLRTLTDLARDPLVDRALREAQVQRLVTRDEIDGSGRLAALLDTAAAQPTRSALERALLRIVRAAGLPKPRVNHRIGTYTVDFAWPAHRLIVETDGYAAHGDRHAFEADRARDAHLAAQGWTVIRFTWRQLHDDPLRVAARLAQALLARPALVPG
jgi:very-short-patch-repair endonuclease